MFTMPRTTRWVALALAAGLVTATAACGSDDEATSAAPAPTTGVGAELRSLVGVTDDAGDGGGEKWKIGTILANSGYGSFYGETEGSGVELAVEQIKAAGGPDIEIVSKDNKSGDATAGVTGVRQLATEGVGVTLADYIGDLGALYTPLEQYKMLGIDGGGGTGGFGRSKPYFYGTRSETPGDAIPGLLEYIKQTQPNVKRIALIAADFGQYNDLKISEFKQQLADAGFEFATWEIAAGGTTDYTTSINRTLATKPDLIIPSLYGTDSGLFAKQYEAGGYTVPIIGSDFNTDAVKAAGASYDGWTFAQEYFDADNPTNRWAEIAAQGYQEKFGKPMVMGAATYYEDTFLLWALYREVKASGGDVNSGEDLKNALEKIKSFPSVYGGEGDTVGTKGIDLQTHSVSERAMGVYQWDGTKVNTLATFGIKGADFTLEK